MIIYSKKALRIQYEDNEIIKILDDYISHNDVEMFSYIQFCKFLFNYADEHNKLGKEKNISYLSVEMMPEDYRRVSRIIWEKIWNREIIIDFYKDPYNQNYVDDTRFIIIRKKQDGK